jgi:hypothetical protein
MRAGYSSHADALAPSGNMVGFRGSQYTGGPTLRGVLGLDGEQEIGYPGGRQGFGDRDRISGFLPRDNRLGGQMGNPGEKYF